MWPAIVFFLGPTKTFPSYGKANPRIGDTVLVNPNTAVVAGGEGVKTTENKIHWPRWVCRSQGKNTRIQMVISGPAGGRHVSQHTDI